MLRQRFAEQLSAGQERVGTTLYARAWWIERLRLEIVLGVSCREGVAVRCKMPEISLLGMVPNKRAIV